MWRTIALSLLVYSCQDATLSPGQRGGGEGVVPVEEGKDPDDRARGKAMQLVTQSHFDVKVLRGWMDSFLTNGKGPPGGMAWSQADLAGLVGIDAAGKSAGTVTVEPTGAEEPSDVLVRFTSSVDIDVQILQASFGRHRDLPRLKPNQPTLWSFEASGRDFDGVLVVELDVAKKRVDSIRISRFPR